MFARRSVGRVRRWVSLVVWLVGLPVSSYAAQVRVTAPLEITPPVATVCESSVPLNIDPGMLRSTFLELLQRSETLRRQCARIAATRTLRVTLTLSATLAERGIGGVTSIDRFETGAIRAEVTLLLSRDYLEMLAHEFEHILEQIDGVVLQDEVALGRAWRRESGSFETRRAADAGVRALREYSRQTARARRPR
jgi:hypothetical protein